jgi:ADP-heptose:LPS heptosyltransferase
VEKVLILAEWTENFKEHFTPLVAGLRERHKGENIACLLYKTSVAEPENITHAADPFDDILVVAGPKALALALRDNLSTSVTYVFVKHRVLPGEWELCRVIKQQIPNAIYLLRNNIYLTRYLESGIDQKHEIENFLQYHKKRETEILLKVYPVYSLGVVLLSFLRIPALFRKAHNKHKILFIRLDVMGDMILSLPALLAIREQFPNSEISILASKRSGAIIEEQQKITPGKFCDYLHHWEAPWHRPEHKEKIQGLKALLQLLKGISTLFFEGFDIVIQPVELGTGVLFSTLLLGKTTIALIAERLPLARLLKRHVQPVSLPYYQQYHIADLPNFMAAELGAKTCNYYRHKVLTVAREELEVVIQRFKALGWNGSSQIIAINIGAGHPKRQWTPAKYAALMEALLECNNTFPVLLGGEGEIGLKKLILEASSVLLPDLVGELNLNQLIAVLSMSEVVVTPDTGVMHIAAALNKKIVALFGAGLVPFCKPLCDTYTIVKHELGCSGCGDKCFTDGEAPCISLISVVDVLEAIRSILPAN